MNEKWTAEQLKAISLRGKHILVSASAGSGKTSVMTERVLSLIEEGYTLDQMLIVTFTRAAAADMKEKLAAKIIRSTNPLVRGQLERLAFADISTLHSFCQRLISTYFYTVGADPEFNVLEDSSTLLNQSIDAAIKEFSDAPSAAFTEICEIFTDAHSDFKLKNIVTDYFYSKQTGQPGAQKSTAESLELLFSQRRNAIIEKAEKLKYATLQAGFKRNFAAVTEFKECLFNGCVPVAPRGKIEPQFISLNEDLKELKEQACALIADYARVKNALGQSGTYLTVLEALSLRAQEIFTKHKAEKSRLDFSDLEHYALKIINSEAGEQIREKYKFIFVDEYQDINPLQDQIVEALKGDNYLFLVGDIKQSIYAFRGCEPDIFLRKTEQFSADGDKEVIELNANHRSLDGILDFSNRIFSFVMTKDFGGVDYGKSARFILSGKEGGAVKIHTAAEPETDLVKSFYKDEKPAVYNIKEHEKSRDAQADAVTACVLNILSEETITENGQTRPVSYKDIAVLCRSVTDTAHAVCSSLSALNIPVALSREEGGGIYVNALVNYLRLISNPLDDEVLINALKSYFGGFTDDALAQIRLANPYSEHFYEAAYAHASTKDFYAKLNHYRGLSGALSVSGLCGAIVSDFEYFQYLFIKGAYAVRELEKFLEEAQAHEGESLYEFLSEYKDISLKDGEPDAVSVMTVHASKGLEFPFVILIDVQKKFNLKDLYGPVLIFQGDSAIKHYDCKEKKEYDSQEWLLNYFTMQKRRREEELRLLYVAVTRAKYRLDIFSSESFKEVSEYSDLSSACSYSGWLAPFYPLYKSKNSFAAVPLAQTPLRVAPKPDEKLVFALNERFKSVLSGDNPLSKTYVTALIDYVEDAQLLSPLCAHDDRALERGILYHKAMELIDFGKPFDWGAMDEEIKKDVNKDDIETCFNAVKSLINGSERGEYFGGGECGGECCGVKYYKEKGFMLNQNNTLIQGVIDLLITDGKTAIIVDYKTGLVHQSHAEQLSYYALAVEHILNLKVTKKLVYSFISKKLIEM